MEIGFVAHNSGPRAIEAVRAMPRLVEDLGYSSVWFTDHVIGMEAYRPLYEPEWAECLTALTHAAATTERIKLGTSILVVPYRDPVYSAKVFATIDQLSDGRLIVGVGSGWSRREYAALGRGHLFAQRGAVLDESLDLMLRCWEGGSLQWTGEHFRVPQVDFAPTPHQTPHPPLWIGGNTRRAIRRAARVGDAWHPSNLEPDDFAALSRQLDDLTERPVARTMRKAITEDDIESLPQLLAQYEDLGCTAVTLASYDWDYDVQISLIQRIAKKLRLAY